MDPLPEEDKEKKNKKTFLLLNTPGACFLCLQDNEEGPVDDVKGIVDLSSICHHLNINQGSLLTTSLENDEDTRVVVDLEQDLCSFSVKLCPKCLDLTMKLNEKLLQLEKAKLMVNHHLWSFYKVLEGTEREESLEWINLLGRMHANLDNSFEAKLVQLLRNETRDKSSNILKKAEATNPQVILSKCPAPLPLPTPEKFPPSINLSTTPEGTSTPIKTLLSQLIASNVLPSKKSTNRTVYRCRCPYCYKIINHSKFSVHLSCLHSDKLLSSYFPSSLPPSEQTCRKVLSSEVIAKATKIATKSSTTAPSRLGCHICGVTYSDGTMLKQHFLLTHPTKLFEKINIFENNNPKKRKLGNVKRPAMKILPNLHSQPQVPKSGGRHIQNLQLHPSNFDKDNFAKTMKVCNCPYCEDSIVNSKFTRHLANLHPEKLLVPLTTASALDKVKDDNPYQLGQLCRKVLASQLAKAAKIPSTSTSSSTVSTKLCCHLCANIYSDGRDLKYHFLVDHTDKGKLLYRDTNLKEPINENGSDERSHEKDENGNLEMIDNGTIQMDDNGTIRMDDNEIYEVGDRENTDMEYD